MDEHANASPQGDRLVTRTEASKRLGICERYLDQLLDRGVLPRVRLGRAVRLRESDVARLIEAGDIGEEVRP